MQLPRPRCPRGCPAQHLPPTRNAGAAQRPRPQGQGGFTAPNSPSSAGTCAQRRAALPEERAKERIQRGHGNAASSEHTQPAGTATCAAARCFQQKLLGINSRAAQLIKLGQAQELSSASTFHVPCPSLRAFVGMPKPIRRC